MSQTIFNPEQRLTRAQKNKDDKQWFKDNINTLDKVSFTKGGVFGFNAANTGISEYRRMKINYDLFNNIINKADFEKICSPFGEGVGELPVDFTNKDIISGKIKALLGMEMKRPFSWKIVATNKEATTRKEQEEFGRLKDFVQNSIMQPIRLEIEKKYASTDGKKLTPDEEQKIQEQVQQELQTMTPDEVKKYMERDHQDPAEALAHQLLQYLIQKEDIKMKFNKAWKHGRISGREIFWVGAYNGEPTVKVVNPLRFDYDKSPELDYIEDGEWACYETHMTPSEVVKYFGSELSLDEIDDIYKNYSHASALPNESFTFRNDGTNSMLGTRVLHAEWKSLKPFKFLKGVEPETGLPYEDIVDESYVLNYEVGDIEITTEWIPTKYEGYLIDRDKYAYLREVPGQHKDLDNLHTCKLSYIGAAYDNLNSEITSLVDRMKYYQYMFNIIWYRVELLMASDDGKALLLNSNLIPKSAGLDIEKWMYYFKVNKIGLLDPSEEGNKGNSNMGEAAKEIDLSLVSDIQKYQMLAEYFERRCGESVGITKQIEGQINGDEAVRNTQQALVQSANILEPYFDIHNNIKRNVLQALIECAKVAYSEYQPASISYVLDDMSIKMLQPDYDLLENSTYGLFVSNSTKAGETLQTIQQLSHAAMQNQMLEMSDLLVILNSESTQEAEEVLKKAEKERIEREQSIEQQKMKAQAESEEKARQFRREEWDHEMVMMEREEELKTDREIQKQTILSLGFNEDKDLDKDGTPDVMEVAKFGIDANLKSAKIQLDSDKFQHQKVMDKEKLKLDKEKNTIAKAKNNQLKSRTSK